MRDPYQPGYGAIATPWPDGAERWGDFVGRDAVFARLLGIEDALKDCHRSLDKAIAWSAGWTPAPPLAAEVDAIRAAMDAAVAKVRSAIGEASEAARSDGTSQSRVDARSVPRAASAPAARGRPAGP
jgi:hypothetical protein